MCGIIGIVSKNPIDINEAIDRLKKLEYRGYDSAGFVTKEGFIIKSVGEISKLKEKVNRNKIKSNVVVLHTRWATHGGVTEINTHPHTDCTGNIFVVHNGTIDNYKELKRELEKRGHKFKSETDTEIIAHIVEEMIKNDKDINDIAKYMFERFKGTYAILILIKNENKLWFIKNGSPLVMGVGENEVYVSSDVYAFLDKTQNVIMLEDYEYGEIKI